MKINCAEFYTSVFTADDFPSDDLPVIIFVGRSNVGKSSIINCLLRRRSLAKTSNTPGKTRALNFYLVNDLFYFVDLPGYGFAKVSMDIRGKWGALVEDFLKNNKYIVLAIQLIDMRHLPTNDDLLMYQWLDHYSFCKIIVANKADKISPGRRSKHLNQIKKKFALFPGNHIISFSAKTGEGKKEVWDEIKKVLK